MTKINSLGLYVHIPFCVRKCLYCDFVSYAGKSDCMKSYVDELCREIEQKGRELANDYYVDTIFFGGGTPTVLEAEDLIRILECIADSFVLGCINARSCQIWRDDQSAKGSDALVKCDGLEISFEANPGTIDEEKLAKLKTAGFNRISIGVQSFDDGVLSRLGRIHDAGEAEKAVRMAKNQGFNTNLDLMFGVPGQSLEIWRESLKRALTLDPDHISFYSLQLEEGTPLYQAYRYGNTELPSWDENRRMYALAMEMLGDAGYHHYEISNASKPGYECRHNLKYWSMQDYLGVGTAAHSYIKGKRFFNSNEISGWKTEADTDTDEKGDYLFTRLRLLEGFPEKEYKERFGTDFWTEFKNSIDSEMLISENEHVKLTQKGLNNTNNIMVKLLE